MKAYTYHEFCATVSQEEAVVFMGYISMDAQKLDVNFWKARFGEMFNVRNVIFINHLSDDGVRPLEIEVLYNYQNGFMKVDVVQVIEYKCSEELDLLFKAQNLLSEYVPQSH